MLGVPKELKMQVPLCWMRRATRARRRELPLTGCIQSQIAEEPARPRRLIAGLHHRTVRIDPDADVNRHFPMNGIARLRGDIRQHLR